MLAFTQTPFGHAILILLIGTSTCPTKAIRIIDRYTGEQNLSLKFYRAY
jgi:hypothetical protein